MEKALRKQTIRRNGRWAKVDRKTDGTWYAALGFTGEVHARRVVEYSPPWRYGAMIAACNWVDDIG